MDENQECSTEVRSFFCLFMHSSIHLLDFLRTVFLTQLKGRQRSMVESGKNGALSKSNGERQEFEQLWATDVRGQKETHGS